MSSTPSTTAARSPKTEHVEVPTLSRGPEPPKPPAPPPAPKPSLIDKLPDWASRAWRSPRAWKTFVRCWFAAWISFVVLLPTKSLQTMGNAALFSMLTTILLSPNLPFALVCWFMCSMMIGVLLAWAFGAAGMKAAVAARSQVLLREQYQEFQASVAGYSNPDQLFRLAVFEGEFLDVRSTVVWGVFMGVSNFFFAVIRAYRPMLIFMSIFGTIVIDVFCAVGPLFPNTNYYLLNSVIISISVGMAIALICSIFIFPESANHMYLSATSDIIGKLGALFGLHELMLRSDPAQLQPNGPILTRLGMARVGLLDYHTQLRFAATYLDVEFSYGKWSGNDVRALEERLLTIIARTGAFHTFANAAGSLASQLDTVSTRDTLVSEGGPPGTTRDTFLLRQFRETHSAAANTHSLRIQDIFPIIHSSTADLRRAAGKGLQATKKTIDFVNERRYARHAPEVHAEHVRELDAAIAELRAARDEFEGTRRLQLVEPYVALVRSVHSEHERHRLPMQALLIAYAYASNLIVSADAVLDFMTVVRDTMRKREKARVWGPTRLRASLAKLLASRQANTALGESAPGGNGSAEDLTGDDEEVEKVNYRRDPDSSPPTNVLQYIPHLVHMLIKWVGTAEGLFVIKYVILSIALWLPAIFKSTAHFYYVQKGIWALIMAQTSLNVYAGDQLFNYMTRLGCTVAGLILGLIAWYIGCQDNKQGSPYGIAAAVGVVLLPIVFIRINSPPRWLGGTVIGGGTFALVIGYSWIDGHLAVISDPGVGWGVAWKRWVLVIIGVAASCIIMFFPVKSGRKSVRVHTASLATNISRIYSSLMSIWVAGPPKGLDEKGAPGQLLAQLDAVMRPQFLGTMRQAQVIREEIVLARWEGNLRGSWPADKYERILRVESSMLTQLTQLGNSLGHISPEWRQASLSRTGIVNPHFITDVMSIFSHVANSLSTGNPLPEVLPKNLLDRFFYHHHHHPGVPKGSKISDDGSVLEEDLPQFSTDLLADLQSVDYMHYATALLSILQLIQGLDDLHLTTKELCGELPMRGFERWRNEYERTHTLV